MDVSLPVRRYLMPVLVALAGCSAKPPPPPPPPEVTTLQLQMRPAPVIAEYVAQVEASNTAEIRPRVGGLLEKQNAFEGASVKAGQVLFLIDPQPYIEALAQAKASLAQAQATLQQASRDLSRVQPLSALNAVSQQELDAVVARGEAGKALVDAARAAVRTAELNLAYTKVTSPIDGVVGRAQFRTGGLVTAYTSLLTTVYASDPMFVNFSISETRVLELYTRYGITRDKPDRTRVFKVILSNGQEFKQPSKLDFIDAAVDPTTGTLAVRLSVPNPEHILLPGQFARVQAAAAEAAPALMVPQRAVQEVQGKTFIWVLGADSKVENRDVKMGARLGTDWIVEDGVKVGETIVVDGIQKLKPGMAVMPKPKEASATPAPGAPPPAPGTPPAAATPAKPS